MFSIKLVVKNIIITSSLLVTQLFALDAKLSLSEIYELKNPYELKLASSSELSENSKEFIRLNAQSDRFENCKGHGMIAFIALANHMAVMEKAGQPETKSEAMKYMADQLGLEYPFDISEIESDSAKRIEKLAIETGVEHPGSGDSHLENIASIFWDKCLRIPISVFESDWIDDETEYDADGYDKDGFDEQGNTREDNKLTSAL